MPASITSLGLLAFFPLQPASDKPSLTLAACSWLLTEDAEYAAFPLHVNASGNAIQRPTVVSPKLPPIDAPAMLRDGYTRALVYNDAWVTVRAKLLAAAIKSVLPQDLMALRDPQHAFLLLTLPVLLDHIKEV
jgi:hypothetical protein